MAEIYTRGKHRIFYRSTGFKSGLVVMVDLLYSDLTSILHQADLEEVGGGLYYFDCSFPFFGTYVGVFYENGTKILTQNFLVVSLRGNGGNLL